MSYAVYDGDVGRFVEECLKDRACPHQAIKEYTHLSDDYECIIDEKNKVAMVFSAELAHEIFKNPSFERSVRLSLLDDSVDMDEKIDMYLHYLAMPVFAEKKSYPEHVERRFVQNTYLLRPFIAEALESFVSLSLDSGDDLAVATKSLLAEAAARLFTGACELDAVELRNHAESYMVLLGQTAYRGEIEQAAAAIAYFKSISAALKASPEWFAGDDIDAETLSPIVAQWAAGFIVPMHTFMLTALVQEWVKQGGSISLDGGITAADTSETEMDSYRNALIPFQFANRDCVADAQIGEYHFSKDMRVIVFLGIANWDDARGGRPMLEFGPVERPCLGMGISNFARLNLLKLLRNEPGLKVAGKKMTCTFSSSNSIWKYASLSIV